MTTPRLNQWQEPTGDDVIERGDYVKHKRGTTSGFVIGVTTRQWEVVRVAIVLAPPAGSYSQVWGWLEKFPAEDMEIVKKGVK